MKKIESVKNHIEPIEIIEKSAENAWKREASALESTERAPKEH